MLSTIWLLKRPQLFCPFSRVQETYTQDTNSFSFCEGAFKIQLNAKMRVTGFTSWMVEMPKKNTSRYLLSFFKKKFTLFYTPNTVPPYSPPTPLQIPYPLLIKGKTSHGESTKLDISSWGRSKSFPTATRLSKAPHPNEWAPKCQLMHQW